MIIDNLFTTKVFKNLQNILYSSVFDWKYIDGTAYDISNLNSELREKIKYQYLLDDITFAQTLYSAQTKEYNRLFDKLEFLIFDAFERNEIKCAEILRVRAGMILGNLNAEMTIMPHLPHVDININHNTALIYFTTCDAPTIIYKERHEVENELETYEYLNKKHNFSLNEKERVDCIENRMFVFDGLYYHSSTKPTNTKKRIALTINFIN